ncbi:MAG: hypothetical protein U1F09_13155 [Steroidobacteraceae bacterium]
MIDALSGTVYVRVYNGAGTLMGEGTMAAPWATRSGSVITVSEVSTFGVLVTGTPDASGWYLRFEDGSGHWVRGPFGPGGNFTWSAATWTSGQGGQIGTVTLNARGTIALVGAAIAQASAAGGLTVSGSYTPEISADFETGSGPPAWFDTYGGGSTTTEQAYSGTKSLKLTVNSGQFDVPWLAGKPTNRLGQGDEIWARFRTYFPAGYNFSAGPHLKFFRIDVGSPASGGHGAHLDWYIRSGVSPNQADATGVGVFDFIQEEIQSWLYDTDALPTGIVRGQWQTWNFYYKLHSVASSARIRLWRDNTLLVDTNARATLGSSTTVVGCKTDGNAQGIMVVTYWNGGAPATQSFYLDDFVVATSASPPASTDSGGRIWIGV